MKFSMCCMSLFYAICLFFFFGDRSTVNVKEKSQANTVVNSAVLFNPVLKQLVQKPTAFQRGKIDDIISTRRDFLVFLDINLNNLMFSTAYKGDLVNGIDQFMGYFQKPTTLYEVFCSIKVGIKRVRDINSKNATSSLSLPFGQELDYFYEYTDVYDDTSPIRISYENYLMKYIDEIKRNITFTTPNCTGTVNTKPPIDDTCYFLDEIRGLVAYEDQICEGCFSKRRLDYQFTPPRYNFSGVFSDISNYNNGGYYLLLNPNLIWRRSFSLLLNFLYDEIFLNYSTRLVVISFNVVSIFTKAIINFHISFEFSITGYINAKSHVEILALDNNNSKFYQFIWVYIILYTSIIGFLNFFRVIALYRLRKLKTISYMNVVFDCILFGVVIKMLLLYAESYSTFEYYKAEFLTRNWTKVLDYEHPEKAPKHVYDYIDFDSVSELNKTINFYGSLICFLALSRILFFLSTSPIITFITVLFSQVANRLFNVFVAFFIFVVSFSMIFHTIVGKRVKQLSDIGNTIVITLETILGKFTKSDFDILSNLQSILVIGFLIFIKYILFTYVFAVSKDVYFEIRDKYRVFKKREHYKLVGETLFLYFRYATLFFIIKDYFYYRYLYAKVDNEKFVEQGDKEIPNLLFKKIKMEDRVVYLIYHINV